MMSFPIYKWRNCDLYGMVFFWSVMELVLLIGYSLSFGVSNLSLRWSGIAPSSHITVHKDWRLFGFSSRVFIGNLLILLISMKSPSLFSSWRKTFIVVLYFTVRFLKFIWNSLLGFVVSLSIVFNLVICIHPQCLTLPFFWMSVHRFPFHLAPSRPEIGPWSDKRAMTSKLRHPAKGFPKLPQGMSNTRSGRHGYPPFSLSPFLD